MKKNNMDLYYLIYTSSPAKPMDDDSLLELLTTSREANSRFGITGMLIYLPDNFIQLIEGPKDHIIQLYHNIQRDKKHYRVTSLQEGPITERFFPDWAMAFENKQASDLGNAQLSLQDERVLELFGIMEGRP
ncbi:BLUF domain-containing protein [Mucilaginibacter daejeonensis]|uniref:BLUF domain-containing protein n=1 Tax=Mucilaginibacter daejeonensis TaxID=398049 RepID=UPI001D17A08F|nr:BLUF domain-containing protein [Mucilaginibacter daejeonensis]UEG52133.1 BLUF domain-containing protein [Mucilaginibacter daejeonensis]